MAEAMAIVMAPTDSKNKCGIFRLTTPGGYQTILKCNQGGFHAHERPANGQEIYELCGHVYLDQGLDSQFESIDLR